MSGDNIASFLYLAILGSVIGGYFLLANRHQMGKMAQQAAIWALIFVGLAAGAALWQDVRSTSTGYLSIGEGGGPVTVNRSADGHYHMTLGVNGTPVDFLIDTGATDLVLSVQDADRVGFDHSDLNFSGRANTANGMVRTATITLDTVQLGDRTDRNVPAKVSGGAMPGSLLGMSYLSQFGTIQIEGDTMTLIR